MASERDPVAELLNAPCGHWVRRDPLGNSVVTLYPEKGESVTRTAPTFPEAVFAALDALPHPED